MNKAAPRTLVVIPAYNEEGNIEAIVRAVHAEAPPAQVVVVDDGSRDRTARAARAAGAVVVSLPQNMGYGVALQTGYKYALRNGFDRIVQMDADGQHDPAGIAGLLAALDAGADIAVGSRFLGSCEYRIPFARKAGMVLFAAIGTLLMGRRVTDPTSGFIALNRRALRRVCSDRFPGDYPDVDVLLMLHFSGLRVVEAPVVMRASRSSRSMHRGVLGPLYYVFKMSLSILVTCLRRY